MLSVSHILSHARLHFVLRIGTRGALVYLVCMTGVRAGEMEESSPPFLDGKVCLEVAAQPLVFLLFEEPLVLF